MHKPFQLSRFRFTIKALEEIVFPAYKGSAFRGGFGYVFKKVACTQRDKTCDTCLLKFTCVYSYVFETSPPKDSEILRLYPRVPHPFVIEPPLDERLAYPPDSEITFHLVLIGRAIDYLPYFIYTFIELGNAGIGHNPVAAGFSLRKKRSKYTLTSVEGLNEQGDPTLIYTQEDKTILANPPIIRFTLSPGEENVASELAPTLGLRFLTPTRLRYEGSLTDQLPFHVLIRNLLRRISALSYFHCGQRLDWDFKGLIEKAKEVETLSSDLRWWDWERYSTRQGQKMKLGGVVGTIQYRSETKALTGFLPLLNLGQYIHVGKGTSFGLGWYEVMQEGEK
ncbi:MAG: CRISPR system precrRNA processing endoribonuclease RAMP protein Cas6 [Candidatus Brocadiaceae bacterium]|nr:CRISPR system precrRNA processing endoribonuclease RAMP protein Cas6 [Candidatus Brocadiaceae bacterium]